MGVDQPDGTLVVAQAQMEQSIKQQELSANLRTNFFGVSTQLGGKGLFHLFLLRVKAV